MPTSRLEAFSDGVLAIVITVMVLELTPPSAEEATWHELADTTGLGLLTYVLSFVYIGIYWSNHHHLFQLVRHVDGTVLWANLHLLFWLSLVPFTNGWLDAQLSSPAAKNARFRVVSIHVPPFTERWIDGNVGLRTNLVPRLEFYAR